MISDADSTVKYNTKTSEQQVRKNARRTERRKLKKSQGRAWRTWRQTKGLGC